MRVTLPLLFLLAACRSSSAGSNASPSASAAAVEAAPSTSPAGSSNGSAATRAPTASASPATPATDGESAPGPARPAGRRDTESKPMYQRANFTAAQLAKIFAGFPELARIGPDVQLFDTGDGSYLTRSTAPHDGVTFTSAPLFYVPEPGNELLVVVGRNKSMSFVVALSVLANDQYKLASYFFMLNEIAPVALAYKPGQRPLSWTTCWMCPAEQGTVSVREDHHVVIVQQ